MEVTKKEVTRQSFKVVCTSSNYTVEGNVSVNKEAEIQNIEAGVINDGEVYIANFSMYGGNLNVNYTAELTLTNQQKVLSLISEFKKAVV